MKTEQYDDGYEDGYSVGRCSVADELEIALGHVASGMSIKEMLKYVEKLVFAAKVAGIDFTKGIRLNPRS